MAAAFCDLHPEAIGLRLIRHAAGRAYFCQPVVFEGGRAAVDTVLRRAALSGRVEIEGDIADHQADVLIDRDGSWAQTVALDAKSYRSLKSHWMRCIVVAVE